MQHTSHWLRAMLALTLLTLTSACSNYVYSPDPTAEAFFVKKGMSVAEQNTKAATALQDKGFETEETAKGVIVYLPPTIYFEDAKSDINLLARTKIAEIAKEVNKQYLRARNVEISGHTDSVGDEQINLGLSKQRAEAATSELVFSKVQQARLITTWYGESKPRFEEFNEDGSVNQENRSLNRRVEFVILNPS